jgi:hypothetical protein
LDWGPNQQSLGRTLQRHHRKDAAGHWQVIGQVSRKTSYVRAALTVAAVSFAGLLLTGCGADPAQASGAPAGGGDILGLLVSKVLPLVLGGTGVGGGLAGGIPVVLELIRMRAAVASARSFGPC